MDRVLGSEVVWRLGLEKGLDDKVEVVRALVRPVVTLIFTLLVVAMFWTGREIPELLKLTWLAILAEWFGERLLFKLLGLNNKPKL